MNKTWILLIVMGIIFLVVAVGWEAYQTATGARSNINTQIVEYSRSTLFPTTVEKFLNSDPDFSKTTTQTPVSFTVGQ